MFVTTRASGDGASRALGGLISALPPSYDIRLVSLTSVEPGFLRWLRGRPLAPDALHMRGVLNPGALRELAALAAGFRPDVLHTSLSRADWIGRVVGRLARVPRIVSTIQNVHSRMYRAEFDPVRARAGLALDRMTVPLADRIVAVSEGVRADLERRGVGPSRIEVIPNGIDVGLGGRGTACCAPTSRALTAHPASTVVVRLSLRGARAAPCWMRIPHRPVARRRACGWKVESEERRLRSARYGLDVTPTLNRIG
jgi:hypothetical protein